VRPSADATIPAMPKFLVVGAIMRAKGERREERSPDRV
jgi:hypothetical protein